MNAASARGRASSRRVLTIDVASRRYADESPAALVERLRPGDVLVVNDSATLPASLEARTRAGGRLEVRLAEAPRSGEGRAILFAEGSWRQTTESRPAPPRLPEGTRLVFDASLSATVTEVSPISPRLVGLRFDRDGADLLHALYRLGRPVQYSYLARDVTLAEVQTGFATRPWSVEPPSAGFVLTPRLLAELRARGVVIASLTHGAGLSAAGDPALDAALPLDERYDIPAETVAAVTHARSRGGRVVAVGTTVVRALEGGFAEKGSLVAGPGTTSLRIGPGFAPRVVSGLVTGVHEPGTSHHALLSAFAPEPLVSRALAHAAEHGYLGHEFGDACLLMA